LFFFGFCIGLFRIEMLGFLMTFDVDNAGLTGGGISSPSEPIDLL
jgi:hypothetical protein